jgi:hypothetical protein
MTLTTEEPGLESTGRPLVDSGSRPFLRHMGIGLRRIGRIFRRRAPTEKNPTSGLRVLIVTDAWKPQVNGVVRTLETLGNQLTKFGNEVKYLTPDMFRTVPMPTYGEIRLASRPRGRSGLPRAAFACAAIIRSRRASTRASPNTSMRAPAFR